MQWRKSLALLVLVLMSSNCIVDEYETNAQFLNGCDYGGSNTFENSIVSLSMPIEPGMAAICRSVSSVPVTFELASNTQSCVLRGGVSNGNEGTPDAPEKNPIAKQCGDGCKLGPNAVSVTVEGFAQGTYGFYCDDAPNIAGAVFVDVQ